MNETLSVYLNLNMEEEDEALIERIDQLLLMVGLKDFPAWEISMFQKMEK